MFNKKIKKFMVIFLSTVFFMASCLGNLSFAITSETEYENVNSGVYYVKNLQTSTYLEYLDYLSCIIGSFNGLENQRWEFIYVSDGYYNIKNVINGRYLTAPADLNEGSYVEQDILSTSKTDRQLWSLTSPYGRNDQYVIQSKSQESSSLALSCSSTRGVYGYDLIQKVYTNDEELSDEWALELVQSAFLLGIDYDESGHDHTTSIERSTEMLIDAGYITNTIVTDEVVSPGTTSENPTLSEVLEYFETSNFIITRSHGEGDSNQTYILLNESGSVRIATNSIYNFTWSRGLDMSDCDVVAFVGCYTAAHETNSLTHASIAAGAMHAIGFKTTIGCSEAETWAQFFTLYYTSDYSVSDAAYAAVSKCGNTITYTTCQVEMQGG